MEASRVFSTVGECRTALAAASGEELVRLIEACAEDPRAGVRGLAEVARRRHARESAECVRLADMLTLESELRSSGHTHIAGLDEVGRGALAGPLTIGAVVLPPDTLILSLDDSKRLDPDTRARVAEEVWRVSLAWSVVHVAAHVIDVLGMTLAVRQGMLRAIDGLGVRVDHAVVDGLPVGLGLPETAVVKGDSRVAAIAAASVIAKVSRDRMMCNLSSTYPEWNLARNKGYGTSDHVEAIARGGITPVHRRSFAPCADCPTLF